MTPMPPCCAIAMASRDSVTVSIAALASGTFRRMLRVNCDETSTALGSTVECCGTSSDVVEGERGREADGDLIGVQDIGPCVHAMRQPFAVVTSAPAPLRDTSCISCRCRTGRDRCGRPSAPRASPAGPRRRRRCAPDAAARLPPRAAPRRCCRRSRRTATAAAPTGELSVICGGVRRPPAAPAIGTRRRCRRRSPASAATDSGPSLPRRDRASR